MASPIYVTGHDNPDTDSIAAAMGYAWLLRERDGVDTIALAQQPGIAHGRRDRIGVWIDVPCYINR